MTSKAIVNNKIKRREILRRGMAGLGIAGIGASILKPSAFTSVAEAAALAEANGKILVILELSGGNDGLNTVVPYGDDAYYRHRPEIGLPKSQLRILDDHFGLNPGMSGFEELFKDGKMAIVQGCGYENPSYSHFTSMSYWHTAAPNSGEEYGWVGRLADNLDSTGSSNFLVNVAASQSLAVRSQQHVPVVFDEPSRFTREAFSQEKEALSHIADVGDIDNPSRRFLLDIARSANDASELVREAWSNYSSPVDYGVNSLDLPKVVSLIESGMPTKLYYVSYLSLIHI